MKLPRVEKGQAITAEAWNQIVEHVNGTLDCSIKPPPRKPRGASPTTFYRVRIIQQWTQRLGIYQSKAQFYNGAVLNTNVTIDVYAAAGSGAPPYNCPAYVTLIDGQYHVIDCFQSLPTAAGGTGVAVSADSSGNYTVSNTGVLQITDKNDTRNKWIKGNAYIGRGIELRNYMDSVHTDGSPNYDGIGVKTESKAVVKDAVVSKVQPVKKTITYVSGITADSDGNPKATFSTETFWCLPEGVERVVTNVALTPDAVNSVVLN